MRNDDVLPAEGSNAYVPPSGRTGLQIPIAYRDRFAAWLPDGTRFGSLSLGPTTPGAAEKIGQTLSSFGAREAPGER